MNNYLNLLFLNKKQKQEIINSDPLLKQFFSEEKRKPKRLETELALKLKGVRHILKEKFDLTCENFYNVLKIEELKSLAIDQYLIEWDSAQKIKNPIFKKQKELQILYKLQSDLEYLIGKEEKKEQKNDLSIDEQIKINKVIGSKYFEE